MRMVQVLPQSSSSGLPALLAAVLVRHIMWGLLSSRSTLSAGPLLLPAAAGGALVLAAAAGAALTVAVDICATLGGGVWATVVALGALLLLLVAAGICATLAVDA
jgi:hypothetical protein